MLLFETNTRLLFGGLVTCYLRNKTNHTGVEVGHMSHLQYVIHTQGYNWHCVQEYFKGKVTSPCIIWWSSSTSSVQCCWAMPANLIASRRTCHVQSPRVSHHLIRPSWIASSSLLGLLWYHNLISCGESPTHSRMTLPLPAPCLLTYFLKSTAYLPQAAKETKGGTIEQTL